MMFVNKRILFFALSLLVGATTLMAQVYELQSPNKQLTVSVNTRDSITWQVKQGSQIVLASSKVSMSLVDDTTLGSAAKVVSKKQKIVDNVYDTPFYKKSKVRDCYQEMVLKFKGGYSLEFRAYDNAVAYRFVTNLPKPITVKDECAEFNFTNNYKAFIPYVNDNRDGERYTYSFESYYDEVPLQAMYADSLAVTPLLVDMNTMKVAVSDFGAEDYPGMFLVKHGTNGLKGVFAPLPLAGKKGGYNNINFIATKRADYIAENLRGEKTFPWRAIIVSHDDKELANNDLAQCLSPRCRIADTSWIKPGKVAWDWWNNTQLSGVDFVSGQNTDTYKYYIDFASKNALEYIIIDEGWSDRYSLMKLSDKMDLPAIINYGKEKGVGVILWTSWDNVHRDMDEAFDHYAAMGVKGFKVDFFDADDQHMMQDMYKFAEAAAKRHLLLDYHGMKANGLQVAYPNVINFEGVKGLENYRWAPMGANGKPKDDAPRYAVTIPFIRTLVGPMDYTPGAMRNATIWSYTTNGVNPMSQGTRVAQMAMYTIFEAPLQMLADSPTAYMKNQACCDFIAKVPTTFDDTQILDGQVGEYIITARCKNDVWYLGALTNWNARKLTIDFSFLPKGDYEAVIFQDGVNADKEASDYKQLTKQVSASDKWTVTLAPGGGWTARLTRK